MSKENNKRPSFQFYPSDWLSDPNTSAMSAEEEGAYIRLLCYMWNTEDCSLKDDEEYLSRLGRVDKVVITSLYPCFKVVRGKLRHKRLDYEREKQDNYRVKCSEAGKKGMKKRWEKAPKNKVVITKDNSSTTSTSTSSFTSSTTTGVVEKLVKWLSTMEDISNPRGYAKTYTKKYSERIIAKALNNSTCISRNKFTEICDNYVKKETT